MNLTTVLPDNAYWGEDGLLYHRIERMTEGGSKYFTSRRLALSLEEAREKHVDFYHPTLGLIWEGSKLARDRDVDARLHDSSVGGQVPAGANPVPALSNVPAVD